MLLLERGKNVEHVKDYVNARRRRGSTRIAAAARASWTRRIPCSSATTRSTRRTSTGGSTSKESPYTEVKRFDWYRGYQVGGRSLMWGRQSYRQSDLDFEANAKEGIAIDWPIRYADIAPWYDHVERHAGIAGSRRRAAAAARRPVPAGDAAQLRRGAASPAGWRSCSTARGASSPAAPPT